MHEQGNGLPLLNTSHGFNVTCHGFNTEVLGTLCTLWGSEHPRRKCNCLNCKDAHFEYFHQKAAHFEYFHQTKLLKKNKRKEN